MKKSIAIIGGGPAAFMLASQLQEDKFDVSIYEQNAAPGRKFLVAGDGGFNLSHSEELDDFVARYSPSDFFKPLISTFSNNDLRVWLSQIGIETFIGTSKRIFPVNGIKPIDVLNAILDELKRTNVSLHTNHRWAGWQDEQLSFETKSESILVKADIIVFALGGASWKVTGSDGSWVGPFSKKGITIVPFQSSNCAYEIKWKSEFISAMKGQSLKNISLSSGGKSKKGEIVITDFGLEGGAIYALSPQIRKQLNEENEALIFIDLKPTLTMQQIKDKFSARGNRSIKKLLIDRLNLDNTQIELLKTALTKDEFTDPELLAARIKQLPLSVTAAAPIDEAISTVGGIDLNELDEHFQLKKLPNNYCIGEMLDWDAPTGGYLLQGCFSMGNYLAKHLNSL
ncbi:MAG TPA: TIGR03862 family flavoprotein [Bacteroidia bacterium]|jgi:hypothetical protein